MRKNRTFLRTAAAMTVAVGVLVFSAAGAGAAGVKPTALRGTATADALHIKLFIPGTAELVSKLEKELGINIPVPAEVRGALPSIPIELKISSTNASSAKGTANGFAQALIANVPLPVVGNTVGDQLTTVPATTTCSSKVCTAKDSTDALTVPLLDGAGLIPGGIGSVVIAGAHSQSTSPRDTMNRTSIAEVNLTLANLLNMPQLKPVKDVLDQLRDVINGPANNPNGGVLDTVNGALEEAEATIDGLLEENASEVNKVLKGIVEVGTIKDIPDLSDVSLLDLTVLGSESNVVRKGSLLRADGIAKVADLSVMGDWLSIESVIATAMSSVDLDAQRTASSIPSTGTNIDKTAKSVLGRLPVDADKTLSFTGLDLGGLLKINAPEAQLINDKAFNDLKAALRRDAKGTALESTVEDVLAALDILHTTAGVKLQRVKGSVTEVGDRKSFSSTSSSSKSTVGGKKITSTESAADLNLRAASVSDQLVLTVEPMIPLVQKGDTPTGALVPRLGKDDYLSTGIKLQVLFPKATTEVAQGAAVLGVTITRTGVGTPWVIVGVLLGAAVLVRRFAISR